VQLNTKNKQISFREYKLVFNPSQFTGTDKDIDKMLGILEGQLSNQKLTFEQTSDNPKVKKVWYLDNQEHELYQKNNFITRVKENQKKKGDVEFDVTFKIRTAKKEMLSSYDLFTLNPLFLSKMEEQKFEEDIVSDSTSRFSISTELEYKNYPALKTWNDVLSVFPNLVLDSISDNQLVRVNGLEVRETAYKLGKLLFQGEKKAEVGFSIWTNPSKSKSPVIGEFDIDINVEDLNGNNDNNNDKFSDPAVSEINELYKKLQDHPVVYRDNVTKTEYIYKYKE
jgi:hypothetical protein